MKKITVFVEPNKPTEVFLDEPLVTGVTSTMTIKNVTAYWRYENVVENDNDTMTLSDNTQIQFLPGFHTFDMIKEYLNFNDIEIEKTPYNGGCRIKPIGNNLLMGKFAPILGHNKDEELTADVWETSPHPMNVYRDLMWINVHCNIVNEYKNYDQSGKRSGVAITLPVPTDGNLMGVVTTYDLESRTTVYNGAFSRLEFSIGNNTPRHAEVGVLLEAYITP